MPGETTQVGPVTIVAPLNVPSLLPADASELLAKNQFNLLALMLHDNIVTLDWTDEVIAKTALTHDGKRLDDKPGGNSQGVAKPTSTPSRRSSPGACRR